MSDNEGTRELKRKSWRNVSLFRQTDFGEFSIEHDITRRAKAFRHWRDTRKLPEGYSFFPFTLVDDVSEYGDAKVLHIMSLVWYHFDDKRMSFTRITDPKSIDTLSRCLLEGRPIPEGCTTVNLVIEYDGIDDVTAFNRPKFKIPQR